MQKARDNEWYTITIKASSSVSTQWTLGTASKKFDNSKFDTGSAYLSGTGSSSFDLTQTANGWLVESDEAHPSGYNVTFHIQPTATFASTTYELTQAETGLSPSINNLITYSVVEDVNPQAQSLEVSPASKNLSYGNRIQVRANISDNYALGLCKFEVSGADSFVFPLFTSCKTTFVPTIEGTYNIKVTPVDYYSNEGSSIEETYVLNLLPKPVSTVLGNYFYTSSNMLEINSTFNLASSDDLGTCEVLAKNSSGETSLGSFSASGRSCYSSSISLAGLGDGNYEVYTKVRETTENNLVIGNSSALFVCNGEEGMCRYADFNDNGQPDNCPDVFSPAVTLISPADGSSTTETGISFVYNVSDDSDIANCILVINNVVSQTSTSVIRGENSFSATLDLGNYNWRVDCNDTSGNNGRSSTSSFVINSGSGCSDMCDEGDVQNSCFNASREGVRTCGNYDSDSCTEWDEWSYEDCGTNQTCANGECRQSDSCTHQWTCSWGDCINETQEALDCVDTHSCNNESGRPRDRGCNGNCSEKIACEWKECIDGFSTPENCSDLNDCSNTFDWPGDKKCNKEGCYSDYKCSQWSTCSASFSVEDVMQGKGDVTGTMERACKDSTGCIDSGIEKKSCSLEVPITTERVVWCQENYVEIYQKSDHTLLSRIREAEFL